jgi:uncharacterized membrane protein HdeD (DUF308 family)
MGIVTILLGALAIYLSVATTLISVALLGVLVFASGIAQVVYAFSAKKWSGTLMHVFLAVLYSLAGILLFTNPVTSAMSLTLLLAFLFMISGASRIIMSIMYRPAGWGWVTFSGFVSAALGVLIVRGWPAISFWLIGCYLGIDLVLLGTNLTSFAFLMKNTESELQKT